MELDVAVQSLGLLIKKDDGGSSLQDIAYFQISTLRGAVRSYSSTAFTV